MTRVTERRIAALSLFLALCTLPVGVPTARGQDTASERPSALEDLSETYRQLSRYRDRGTLTVTTYDHGTERTESLHFATRRGPLAFELKLWPETGSQTVIWAPSSPRSHRPELLYRYDAAENRYAAQASLPRALPRSLGPAARLALLVPHLLFLQDPLEPERSDGGGGEDAERSEDIGMEEWPGAWMGSAEPAMTTGQPCPDAGDPEARCWVLTFTAPPEARPVHRVRVWRGEEDGLVRRVEVEGGPEQAPTETAGPGAPPPPPEREGRGVLAPSRTWIRVEVVHEPETAADEKEPELPFTPPPGAERVARLAEPEPEGPLAAAGREREEPIRISESIRVAELLLPVRVTDREGQAVKNLSARDFRLTVDGKEVPLQAATWVGPDSEWFEEIEALPLEERREMGLERVVPGRLIVLFFQTDFNAVRIKGHMAFLPKLEKLLAALEPTDRVAVAAFDSHLKLWQDFTTEREPVLEIARDAFRFGARGVETRPGNVRQSLAEHLNPQAARDAAWVEHGLAELAGALEPFVADKVVLFVGWGVGHNGTGRFRDGYRALQRAGVTLHALDVTYAGGHTLGAHLASLAQLTGGTYSATHEFPDQAVERVTVALSGHYELSVSEGDLPREEGQRRVEFRVELRDPDPGWRLENGRGELTFGGP